MKTQMLLSLCLLSAWSCNKAKFGSEGAKKGGSAVLPHSGSENPENEPLDVSELEKNQDRRDDGGPVAGEGERLSKVIELTCDDSQGAEVDFGPGQGKAEVESLELLGGKDVDVDTDGNPVGGKPDGGKPDGGKPDGGKPDPDLPGKPPVTVPDASNVVAKVKGQFCPASQNRLTILFVVDYSGSMGRHVPGRGQHEVPGNDPQINGSCGRLRAARAILDKVKKDKAAGDTIEIGMVPFAGGIVTNRIIKITDLAAFDAMVSKDTFCQYVIQDPSFGYDPVNPGGIDGPGGLFGIGAVDSSTNYRAAFNASRSMLSGVYGRKVVYFISDGEPTSGGADPVQAGIDAGAELRNQVDNLQLNALLLGNTGSAARRVLEGVAGSADRVRTADDADELAREILEFPDAAIDESTGRATLTVAPYPAENLGLRYLNKDPSQDGVWIYETQPFVLLGKPGETVINRVEVTAQGQDGSTHSAIVKIKYRQ